MSPYILGERNGSYVIDLQKTLDCLQVAYLFVRDLAQRGGTILFVATKKQVATPVALSANRCGMPYVNKRWLGGMLTNFPTIHSRVQRMLELEQMKVSGDFDAMPKKEALYHERELSKLKLILDGIRTMERPPDAIFVIDTKKEAIAIAEAKKLELPVIALVDTNCDPDFIRYVIPGNDDAMRAGVLISRVIADAVLAGKALGAGTNLAGVGGGANGLSGVGGGQWVQ
jgi:small subunit ribosomal protein S2